MSCNGQTLQIKTATIILYFQFISNEPCKPSHLNCAIKHYLNVMVCSIEIVHAYIKSIIMETFYFQLSNTTLYKDMVLIIK